jgi:pyranose oxidase
LNGQNPNQDPTVNLDNAAATRTVGGMAQHWTCCTPEPHVDLERPKTFGDAEWKALFKEARELINTPVDINGAGTQFENSIRQQLVKRTLQDAYQAEKRAFKSMPLACQRSIDNPDWVQWSSSSTIFGQITSGNKLFRLWPENQCIKVLRDSATGDIKGAIVEDLRLKKKKLIMAKRYVICAGAVLTPQILFNSGFKQHLPALVHKLPFPNPQNIPTANLLQGRYMTEQTMTFCQIVLKKSLIDSIKEDPWKLGWAEKSRSYQRKYPFDPIPIPVNDPDPQVSTPMKFLSIILIAPGHQPSYGRIPMAHSGKWFTFYISVLRANIWTNTG